MKDGADKDIPSRSRLRPDAYLRQTHRPIVCLGFLLPGVVLYELGTFLVGAPTQSPEEQRVVAYLLLEHFFRLFGVTGLYLPGFALVAILLAWQLATRDRWSVRWQTLAGMAGESVVLAVPLILFNQVFDVMATGPEVSRLAGWGQDLVLSVGAGIYEELVFRLICLTVLSIVFIDLAKMHKTTGLAVMVLLSSLAFAAHHYPPLGGDEFDLAEFLFRFLAGAYLATLYVVRGFGVAAGCHGVYDVIVVTWAAMRT